MHAPTLHLDPPHRNARYQRVVMFFVVMFLALQLLGANAHGHSYAENHTDCAACQVADMPLGSLPPPATVAPVAALVTFVLPAQSHSTVLVRTGYLTPPSHAPPAVAVFS
ncbi:MAG: hypothetical protein ABW069_13600 [Duganella sp.]